MDQFPKMQVLVCMRAGNGSPLASQTDARAMGASGQTASRPKPTLTCLLQPTP